MGLHATVYLTGEEAALLEEFCRANGCSKSAALKNSLRTLGNELPTSEARSELSVAVPPKEQLKALIRKCKAEIDAEEKLIAKHVDNPTLQKALKEEFKRREMQKQ